MTYSDQSTLPLIGDTVFGTPHNDVAPGQKPQPLSGIVVGVEQLPGINLRIAGNAKQYFREHDQIVQRHGVISSDGRFEAVQVEVWGDSRKFKLLHREAA